jgi:catechol 2,3-dioxygenase-like lactoylglutathione lyase family enzyme
MAIHAGLATLVFLAVLTLSAQVDPVSAQTLLGQGRGVDHVGVAVRDLAQAEHDYEQLGFKVAVHAHTPDGVFDSHVCLQNGAYIELLSVNGSTSVKQGMASMIAEFARKHEGAAFLGINVSSAKVAADYLKARNFAAVGPIPGNMMREGETTLPPPMWYSVMANDTAAAGKNGITLPVFFIQYVSTQRFEQYRAAGYMDQPNTAMAIHAVWFAVHDLQAQLTTLRAAGLESGEAREAKFIGAHGRDVNAGTGMLSLLEPSDKTGALAKYLSDHKGGIDGWRHDEGIIGLSIEVANLDKALQLAESATGRKLETYKGSYGTGFLLYPEVTHGVWIEMFQAEQ